MLKLVLIPVVGAVIGWITNVLAITLLFRPYQPVKFLGLTFHGVIPKRRNEIAASIAETIEEELIDTTRLLESVNDPLLKEHLAAHVINLVRVKGEQRMPLFLPDSVRELIVESIVKIVEEEIEDSLDELLEYALDKAAEYIDISKMVEEKIAEFSLEELEKLILRVASRELKHIEILGGVLGFLIGLAQVTIFVLLGS